MQIRKLPACTSASKKVKSAESSDHKTLETLRRKLILKLKLPSDTPLESIIHDFASEEKIKQALIKEYNFSPGMTLRQMLDSIPYSN
jgi:uncharacterized protein (DUF927 family)